MNTLLVVAAVFLGIFLIAIPVLLGYYILYVGWRFKKSSGAVVDQSSFYLSWLIFIWFWAERSKEIAAAMPFFAQDLSETYGIRPDDGEV